MLTVGLMQSLSASMAQATPKSWRDGEDGSGPAPFPAHSSRAEQMRIPSMTWTDLGSDDAWAKPAINHVAGTYDWMRDFAPDRDGNWSFKPDRFETRKRWARAMVLAFDPDAEPDPAVTFTDLDPTDPFYRWAAIALRRGWMTRRAGGGFEPEKAVTAREVHRALVRALGMGSTAAALDRLATTDGYVFDTRSSFGVNLLAMRLGLRFNNKVDESQDVTPSTRLLRKQAAWSLYRATTLDDWVVPYLTDQYAGMVLPKMGAKRHSIVNWGVRYVGYPYIWAGEWGFNSTSRPRSAASRDRGSTARDCPGGRCGRTTVSTGRSRRLARTRAGRCRSDPPRRCLGSPGTGSRSTSCFRGTSCSTTAMATGPSTMWTSTSGTGGHWTPRAVSVA